MIQNHNGTGNRMEICSPATPQPPPSQPPSPRLPTPQPPTPRLPTPHLPTPHPPTPHQLTPRPPSLNAGRGGNTLPSPGRHTREDNEDMEQQDNGGPQKRPRLDPPRGSASSEQSQNQNDMEQTQDSGNKEPPQAETGKGYKGNGKGKRKGKQTAVTPQTKTSRKAKNGGKV